MARDIAKKATKKIKSQIKSPVKEDNRVNKPSVVSASQVRNLVAKELQDRNRPEVASSYTGHPPEQRDLSKPNLNDKEPVI